MMRPDSRIKESQAKYGKSRRKNSIWYMRAFYSTWTDTISNLQQPVGDLDGKDLPQVVGELPWGHNIQLLSKLMGVGKDYEVLVSKRVRTEQNYLGHILTLIDRPIFKPAEKIYWPDKDNLEWHRKKKFAIRV